MSAALARRVASSPQSSSTATSMRQRKGSGTASRADSGHGPAIRPSAPSATNRAPPPPPHRAAVKPQTSPSGRPVPAELQEHAEPVADGPNLGDPPVGEGEDPDLFDVAVAAGRLGHPRVAAGVLAHHPQPRDNQVALADLLLHQQAGLGGVGRPERRQLLPE